MKKKIELEIEEFDNISELSSTDNDILQEAMKASDNAYAPYSGFRVGAAIRLKSGLILSGNNRENASFPIGTCAENTVIAYAGANYPNDPIICLAICAKVKEEFTPYPVSPCGKCRQIIAEEEDRNNETIRIILYGQEKIEVINGVSTLLPLRFNMEKLKG